MPKYHYLEVAEGDNVSDLAALLVAIAQSEGLPLPTTDTGGKKIRFVVSDELLAAYSGTDLITDTEPAGNTSTDTDTENTGTKKSRKKKGS